jgi:hypothetical protein
MARKVEFHPHKGKKKKHKKKHKHHEYCGCDNGLSGHEGRWVGEENFVTVTADSEQECHRRLDALKPFTK